MLGTVGGAVGDNNYRKNSVEFQINTTGGNQIPTVATFPVTFDRSVDPSEAGLGGYDLQAFIGNAYFLKRIVGKFRACIFGQATITGAVEHVQLGVGFFVAREDERAADATGGTLPVGWQAVGVGDPNGLNYDPLNADAINQPWIWRRTWILSDPGATLPDKWTGFPGNTNAGAGTFDGPHIDAKTKRVVPQDHRLWFSASVLPWPFNNRDQTYTVPASVLCDMECRIFAQPMKSRNTGQF